MGTHVLWRDQGGSTMSQAIPRYAFTIRFRTVLHLFHLAVGASTASADRMSRLRLPPAPHTTSGHGHAAGTGVEKNNKKLTGLNVASNQWSL